MSEEKFMELLEPKLKEFRTNLETGIQTVLKGKLTEVYAALEKTKEDLEGDLNEKFVILESNTNNSVIASDNRMEKALREMNFNIQNIDDRLNNENGDF